MNGLEREYVASGLDHVIAAVSDVRGTLESIANLLGLPIAVPFAEYPSWQSGGIWAGNACLFFDSSPRSTFLRPTEPARWRAVSLRPRFEIEEVVVALRCGGYRVDGPKPYVEGGIELWSNAYVPGVVADDEMLFFTAYGQMRRAQFANAHEALVRSDGGPLGVVGVHSIGAGADARWPDVFADQMPGSFRLADGVQIVPDGVGCGLTYVALRVRDTAVATVYLAKRGVAIERRRDAVRVNPKDVRGIDVRLCMPQ